MTASEIIKAIEVLNEVVKANNGWLGDEKVMNEANNKISELIKLLNN